MASRTEIDVGDLNWAQALAWRASRHRLGERAAPDELLDVVAAIGGLHAQLMSSAELSLWARLDGLTRETLDELLWQERALVKLWAMRGTLHLLPSAELGLWLAALGTYTNRGMTGHPEIDRLSEAVAEALRGRELTREELALAVEELSGEPELAEYVRFSWGSYLKAASFRGKLCFAENDAGKVRFTTPDDWLPHAVGRPDPDEALRAVTRRYLAAYGPASAADLGRWWGGLSAAKGRRMLAALGEEAVEVEIEGERGWLLARDLPALAAARPSHSARLLPAFDPYVAGGARDNAALLAPPYRTRVHRPQGWISPTLLLDGRIAGVWRHTLKGWRLLVELEPFAPLPGWAVTALEAEADRLAAYLDAELSLRRLA